MLAQTPPALARMPPATADTARRGKEVEVEHEHEHEHED
jgi:hypothetical protein